MNEKIEIARTYVEKLKHDKEVWEKHLDEMSGDVVDASSPSYRMAVNAANKYASARYVFKVLTGEEI